MVLDAKIHEQVRIKMAADICLLIKNPEIEPEDYPASRIQKGLVLVHEIRDLSEEGIGFAVPVLRFTLNRVNRARMFRGRELVEGRLSWSGLAYVLPHDIINFAYDIRIGTPT